MTVGTSTGAVTGTPYASAAATSSWSAGIRNASASTGTVLRDGMSLIVSRESVRIECRVCRDSPDSRTTSAGL